MLLTEFVPFPLIFVSICIQYLFKGEYCFNLSPRTSPPGVKGAQLSIKNKKKHFWRDTAKPIINSYLDVKYKRVDNFGAWQMF